MCNPQNNMAAQASQSLKVMPDYTPPNELTDKMADHIKTKRGEKVSSADADGYNGAPDEGLENVTVVEENVLGFKAVNMATDVAKKGYKAAKDMYNKSNMSK